MQAHILARLPEGSQHIDDIIDYVGSLPDITIGAGHVAPGHRGTALPQPITLDSCRHGNPPVISFSTT